MDRSAAVTRIQRELGFRTDLSTEIIAALQDAQVELEEAVELPWFLKDEGLSDMTTVADTQTVALPTGFIREFEDDALHIYDSTADEDEQWTPLVKDTMEYLRANYPGSGTPVGYCLGVSSYFLFPIPDAIFNLRQVFYKKDTTLATDVENLWLEHAHDLMIGVAGQKIARALRDRNALVEFEKMEQKARFRLFYSGEAREHENKRYAMGGED